MQVVATAGHVDHGKSALVRALTGMEPDRWAEERRRGLTIDLGFAWMELPGGGRLAFVDVPGHERFVPNMLAGVGPVPAVLFVVAADGGWMPQSQEHLAALDAVGIRHGLLAVTRCDLADPGPATRQALDEIAGTHLGAVEAVAVSAVTGDGLPELRDALARLAASLPVPDAAAPVRLWVDRSFSIRGSGTVVTGTLPSGTIRVGQELLLAPSMRPARIRGIESLGEPATSAGGVARVALNLRGIPAGVPARGMALIEPGRWKVTRLADVRLSLPGELRLPPEMTVHIGSARTPARIRPLGPGIARLTLRDPLPLHVGDRLLLRDPGSADVMILGATVLDVVPPALARRGAAAAAGCELAAWPQVPEAADLLRRHGLMRASVLTAAGIGGTPAPVAGEWLADPARWSELRRQLAEAVGAHARRDPLAIGMPAEAARAALGLPDRALVEALARQPGDTPVLLQDGYLRLGSVEPRAPQPSLPPRVAAGVRAVLSDLEQAPFMAPEAGRLRDLGLDARAIAAAARAGLLLRVNDQIVLAPGAQAQAARVLAGLPQPFTTAQARQALGTTRRVAIPLLEYLDRAGITQRLPDDRRRLRLPLEEPMDLFDLTGKVAVVTGGTRGIGLMMARGLLQAGASVYVSSRKPEAGKAAAAELSGYGRVVSVPADLSSEEECVRLAAEVGRSEERIHILVNNAGATWGAPLEEFPASGWDKVLNLNLKSPFFLTRAFLPLLEAAGTADDPARVINVGSIDGLRVTDLPIYSYSASKAGLHQLTRVLARELGPRHITVNAVAPGPFESKMMAATLEAFGEQIAAASPLGRIGRADDMAGVAVFLSGRGGAYVTGAVIPVDGGIWAAR